jgi:hypothetical protein
VTARLEERDYLGFAEVVPRTFDGRADREALLRAARTRVMIKVHLTPFGGGGPASEERIGRT